MQIQLANHRQHQIADLLWQAQDWPTINLIRKTYGHDAEVALNMIIAAQMDQVQDTDLAKHVLDNLRN